MKEELADEFTEKYKNYLIDVELNDIKTAMNLKKNINNYQYQMLLDI